MSNQDQDEIPRRRGRPTGKNRVPLSAEERRARNAQYERERRNEYAEAMLDLAVAAGCESGISNPELLATVIKQIQRAAERSPSKDIEELQRINENLESQIASLTKRLENEPESCEMPPAKKYKISETSELRTDPEAQTSNCFCNPADRPGPAPNKLINKSKIGKYLKIRKQSRTSRYNEPHSSIKTTLPLSCSEAISSPSSSERSGSETPEPQSSHTENWTEDSSHSTIITDSEQQRCDQELHGSATSLIEEESESDTSDCKHSTFHTQTELHGDFPSDQINQLHSQAMQKTQYNPPPDLVPEVKPFTSQSDIYFQFDQLNIPEIQLIPESEPMADLFTDNDKCLLNELINCNSDLFRTESYDNSVPVRQWTTNDFLTL